MSDKIEKDALFPSAADMESINRENSADNDSGETVVTMDSLTVISNMEVDEASKNIPCSTSSNDVTTTMNGDQISSSELKSSELTCSCINLYVLRNSKESDPKFTMKAIFSHNITPKFIRDDTFNNNQVPIPFVYLLTIFAKRTGRGQISLVHNDRWVTVNEYNLRITSSVFNRHYPDETKRCLSNRMNADHYFLFDTDFPSVSNNATGSDVTFWCELCLFTYYIIKCRQYEIFGMLIDQFKIALQAKNQQLSQKDFNEFFTKCLDYINIILTSQTDKHIILKIMFRMIGLLTNIKERVSTKSIPAASFTQNILNYAAEDFIRIFGSVTADEWLLFKNGLAISLYIQLSSEKQSTENSIEKDSLAFVLLRSIVERNKRREIVDTMLSFLKDPCQNLSESKWIELLTLASFDRVQLTYFQSSPSLDIYFSQILKFSEAFASDKNFQTNLADSFQQLILKNHFSISFESILSLVKLLANRSSQTNDEGTVCRIINHVIMSNNLLMNKIHKCFNISTVPVQKLFIIRDIFQYANEYLLHRLDKITSLKNLLIAYHDTHADAFYEAWFLCFMVFDPREHPILNADQYKTLLETWIESIARDRTMIFRILKKTDHLISAFTSTGKNQRQLDFIDRMVDLCFRVTIEETYHLISDTLSNVQSVEFLENFKRKFIAKLFSSSQHLSDVNHSGRTSLLRLIELRKEGKISNHLVSDLTSMISDKIEISTVEILRDTYEQPNENSFIYNVLFKDWSAVLKIRRTVIDQLFVRLLIWTDQGLKVGELHRWKNYSENECKTACRIWDHICKVTGKDFEISNLVKIDEEQMQAKITIKDTITSCLSTYCQNAIDIQKYFKLLEDMDKRFESQIVRSIDIPPEIEVLVKYTDRLNSYSEFNLWLDYHKQQQISRLTTSNSVNESIEEAEITNTTETDRKQGESINERTCTNLLMEADRIFNIFTAEVNSICNHWHEYPISRLIQLFPDSNYVDHDLKMLEPLLNEIDVVHILKKILDYWKSYSYIRDICYGGIRFLNKVEILPTDVAPMFITMLEINEETPGKFWFKACEDFCKRYPKYESSQVFHIIAQYGLSTELIDFVHSLSLDNVNALREAVNDWDESVVNTKTVLDFTLIKTFLDRIYVRIQSNQQENTTAQVEFDQIIDCIENILNENEFQNIAEYFKSCSESLLSIQRVYQDLSDRERSKRQRILGIMTMSSFYFVHQSNMLCNNNEHQFDINIDEQSMVFGELSELRDRARLIEYSNNKTKNNSEEELDFLRSFIAFVDLVEEILERLSSLYVSGHPFVCQYLESPEKFTCVERNYEGIRNFSSQLNEYLDKWNAYLCMMYEKYIDLTYFSFQQIWTVENYLYNPIRNSENDAGYQLLKYIGIDPKSVQVDGNLDINSDFYKRLENIGELLTNQRSSQTSVFHDNISMTKKVLVAETSEEGVMRAIISFYKLANVPAKANHLFYCTERTNWMEIQAFIYRCFYSKTLHQLIRPERLDSLIQNQFLQLFRALMRKNPKQEFQLGIIATVSTAQSQLIQGLKALDIVEIIHDQQMLSSSELADTIQQYVGKNTILLVTSRIAGLGKTSFIRNAIQKDGKHYIKFPINGNIDVDIVAESLCNYGHQFTSSPSALHIDIGAVDHIQRLNEIIYCLLLFRSFRFGQIAVHVPGDVSIYIEFDASFHLIAEQEKLIICNFLPCQNIDQMNWNALNLEKVPGIQLVVNYLQSIKDQTIIRRDIYENTLKLMDAETSSSLLQEYFVSDKDSAYITWTKLSILIAVYSHLFSGFSRCGHFLVSSVKWLGVPQLRMDILISLINSSKQFTSLSVESVRQNQHSANRSSLVDFSDSIIRWDKSQDFSLVFTATDDPVFVYKRTEHVPKSLVNAVTGQPGANRGIFRLMQQQPSLSTLLPDYTTLKHPQFFAKLASLSRKYFTKSICLICFSQYEYADQQCNKCLTNDPLVRPETSDNASVTKFQTMIADKLQEEYVLTPDNYIKMLLVYLRVQSNLPVLIMGETGCGKTSLIKFLCQKILDDEMCVFRIHAGVTNHIITNEMLKFVRKAEECSSENKRLWVFFDEFNTTPSISTFKEIICERTLLGQPLPKNMVFLGACNPQRCKNIKITTDDDIGIRKDRYELQRVMNARGSAALLYTVVPIPETMLEYVWDYGFLDSETERNYIKTMLNSCTQLLSDAEWFQCTASMIIESQKFFRYLEDASSVSLRDIARFCRLYNWYLNLIRTRDKDQKENCMQVNSLQIASLIALLLCYYFRIKLPKDRQAYIDIIQKELEKFSPKFKNKKTLLLNLLDEEQKKMIDAMELPPDTAINRALKDNIFVLVACIDNRIPVILCGKPGSSKTSSVQIVINNLKGKGSTSRYFRELHELIPVSYQGSQNCTSDSIIKVFQRAEKYTKAKHDNDKLLPVIVFDEIGLAELSLHNPLKVLHSELEVESCRFGFVGLSNWRLDASKMNRAIYVSCPDPDINDLEITAKRILTAMVNNQKQTIRLSEFIIKGLANAYASLHEHVNRNEQYNHYFGLRDYYALIKGVFQDAIQTRNDLFLCIQRQLSINFDGIFDGSRYMWEKFCESVKKNHLINSSPGLKFKTLLDQCLTKRTGRYLMLIAENESTIDYVERYIITNCQSQSVRTLIGSCFSGDLISDTMYTEQYNHRVLMDIILYAERSTILIMRRMGHLYDNLYDLFNQNFVVSAGKKICRIPIGPLYHPRCLVNDDFYCIVFVQRQDLIKCDPPFLNRFEKHIIDMDSLIQPAQKTITSNLLIWLAELLSSNTNKHFPLLQHLFVNYNIDYIHNLVIDAFNDLNISADSANNHANGILSYCKEKLVLASSFDLPLILALQSNGKESSHPLIDQYYDTHARLSFSNILQEASKVKKQAIPDRVIYTYTQLHDEINYDKEENNINEIKLGNFKTEFELIKKIRLHYKPTTQARLLIIRVDYHLERKHILFLKHILYNNRENINDRGIWIIFHLQRNLLNQVTNDVLFNDWNIVMIENLNEHQLISREILMNPSYLELISREQFRFAECTFDERVRRCFTKFRYVVPLQKDEVHINERLDRLVQTIETNHSSIRSIIQNNLSILQTSVQCNLDDWRRDLLSNEIIIGACHSVFSAIQQTISQFYDKYLFLLFSHLEKLSFLDSYLFITSMKTSDIRMNLEQIWHNCLISSLKYIDRTMMNVTVMEIPLILHLHLPCVRAEYDQIRQIRDLLTEDSQNYTRESTNDSDSTLDESSIGQLKKKSVYKKDFEFILNQTCLFEYYYHDLILFVLDEAKLSQLSVSLVEKLLTSNPTQSSTDLLKHLLDNYKELIEILRIFEVCIEFTNDENLIVKMFDEQFIRGNSTIVDPNGNKSHFYRLKLIDEDFYLISPQQPESLAQPFECAGDPFIETSLMNLIELITSAVSITKANNIEQLSTTYGRVVEGTLSLENYSVNNLEKLRSFTSLVRCITTLVPNERALSVFQDACLHSNYDMNYQLCENIHEFIEYLRKMINPNSKENNDNLTQDPLIKLETEFIKNWLVDHGDQYIHVLKSISKIDNNLWKYSARIFTVIDRQLGLLKKIKNNNGQISQDDKEIVRFDQCLNELKDPARVIEHLMVNRIHMHLILDIHQKRTIEDIVQKDFVYLEGNIQQVSNNRSKRSAAFISSIAWLKYYIQYYALTLHRDTKIDTMNKIDQLLTGNTSEFCSTLKLFVIKQLCEFFKVSVDGLRKIFINRNCDWIRPMIFHSNGQQAQAIRRDLILPTPLFRCYDEFIYINKTLSENYNSTPLRQLLVDCSSGQASSYSLFIWFIHHYSRFRLSDMPPDIHLKHLIEEELSETIINHFDFIGYRLIVNLCNNFNNSSYFSLDPNMKSAEIHQRMVALNIVAMLLSSKAIGQTTLLGSLLFDSHLKMPENYTDYIQKSVCLPGLMMNDPVVTQMIDVRLQVEGRLTRNKISTRGRFIFRCSSECLWIFYFENCGRANDRSRCPLCRKEIGAVSEGVLIERQPPQIQMSIEQAFGFIDKYIQEFNLNIVHGYHNITTADQSNVGEKSNHLKLPISFRFMHMLTHITLLVLHDLDLLSNSTLPGREYFQEHFEKDYALLGKQTANPDQSAIWLFKVINEMIGNQFSNNRSLDTKTTLIELEQSIEENIILPHIQSVTNEINKYKLAYNNFISREEQEFEIESFIMEVRENEQRFQSLNFFNVTTIQTVNPLDEFLDKIQLIPQYRSTYPVTTFLMKNLQAYANIQHLYPIVTFINYLIEKYNHRIKRNDAAENIIAFYLHKDPVDSTMSELYRHFVEAWYKLNFDKLQFGCQTIQFERDSDRETFAENTKLGAFLLNTSKDRSSILLAACLKTMGQLQNEIVNFYHQNIYTDAAKMQRTVPLQSIRPRHILFLNKSEISKKLITNGFTINYQYGKSKEIIYDYEEIESTFRNMINGLPLIDVENFHYLNYQFELYGENSSLINHVRARVKQEPLNTDERSNLQVLIQNMKSDMLLNYLGSLDYVFAYLCNITIAADGNPLIIESFIKDYIISASCLNENVLRTPPFSKINLKHVIDLYELLEECAFDQILRNSIRSELSEESLTSNQRLQLVDKFIKMTYEKVTIAPCLRDASSWISILKRLMIRVLMNTSVSVDVALQIYLERSDLWPGHVTAMDIESIDVSDEIQLQHTYIILKGLESKRAKPLATTLDQYDTEQHNDHHDIQIQTSDEQFHQATIWLTATNETKMTSRPIATTKKGGKKLRDDK